MTGWSILLLFIGMGVYGVNQMLGMEYGHTGEILKDEELMIVIGIGFLVGLIIDVCNFFRTKRR